MLTNRTFWICAGLLSIIVAVQIALFVRLRADATAGTVVLRAVNVGLPLSPEDASVLIYRAGERDAPVARGDTGRSIRVPAGTYDVQVLYTASQDRQESWLEDVSIERGARTDKEVEFSAGQLAVAAFVGGREALATDLRVQVFSPDDSRQEIASFLPGEVATIRSGTYDMRVTLLEETREKSVQWLRGVNVDAGLLARPEVSFLQGRLVLSAMNAGKPLPADSVALSIHKAGDVQEEVIDRGVAGVPIALAPGRYDVKATFTQANDTPIQWIREIEIRDSQTTERRVDFPAGELLVKASVKGGAELGAFQAYVYVYRTSDHQSPVTYVPAGEPVTLSGGRYDLRVNFFRSHDRPDIWKRGIEIQPGHSLIEDIHFPSGRLLVRASDDDGTELLGDNVFLYFYAAGEHVTPVAQARSGEEVTLTEGRYDVRGVDSRGRSAEQWQRNVNVESGQLRQTAITFSPRR